jgi:multiple sugar transport system permease protein
MKHTGRSTARGTLLFPYLAGSLVLVGVPAVLSFVLAFSHYDALSSPRWAGLANFSTIFGDIRFAAAVANSLTFIVLAVPLRVLGALLLALLLNRSRRGIGLYRGAVLLPTVVPDAAYALVWLWIFNPLYGPLNQVLGAMGFPTPAWLVDPATAKLVFVGMSLFQIGEGFVMLLAGLRSIPDEYYEAALVAGSTRWHAFTAITVPLLTPWLALLTFRDVIQSLQSTFTHSFLMTGGEPYYATLFLPLLVYEEAFDRFRFSVGSAVMLLMFLFTTLALAGLYRIWRCREFADGC